MNMNRHLNHFKKPMLPSIFISIWPLFGLYLWLQMGSVFALIIGSLLGGDLFIRRRVNASGVNPAKFQRARDRRVNRHAYCLHSVGPLVGWPCVRK